METPANLMTPKNFVDIVMDRLQAIPGPLTVTPRSVHTCALTMYVYCVYIYLCCTYTNPCRSKEWITSMSMGAFMSVAKGSVEEPWLFEAQYRGGPSDQPPIVLIGKG